jgi:hypothetical protein
MKDGWKGGRANEEENKQLNMKHKRKIKPKTIFPYSKQFCVKMSVFVTNKCAAFSDLPNKSLTVAVRYDKSKLNKAFCELW